MEEDPVLVDLIRKVVDQLELLDCTLPDNQLKHITRIATDVIMERRVVSEPKKAYFVALKVRVDQQWL
jgi:hypothetical protein